MNWRKLFKFGACEKWTIAIVIVVLSLLPELVSCGWHLIYGSSASIGQSKVPVPFGWYAISSDDNGLGIGRIPRFSFLPFLDDRISHILFFGPSTPPNPRLESSNMKKLRAILTRNLRQKGYTVSVPPTYTNGENSIYCVEGEKPPPVSEVDIHCIRLPDNTYFGFTGPESDLETFYSIVHGTS